MERLRFPTSGPRKSLVHRAALAPFARYHLLPSVHDCMWR